MSARVNEVCSNVVSIIIYKTCIIHNTHTGQDTDILHTAYLPPP